MKLRRSFSELLTIARSYKAITLVFSPQIDSVVSASLLLRLLKDEDVDVQLAPFYEATKPIDTRSPILLLDVFQRSVVSGYKVLHLDDFVGRDPRSSLSLSLYVLKSLKDIWIVPQELEVLVLAALLSRTQGSIYDEKLLQIHEQLLREAVSRGVYEIVDTLRLFGYPHASLSEALERTLEPYLRGISLNRDGVIEFLKKLGLYENILRSEDRERLVNELEAVVVDYARSRVDLYGSKIVLKSTTLIDDVYELVYILYTAIDSGDVEKLLIIGIEPQLLDVFKVRYVMFKPDIRRIVESILTGEVHPKRIVLRGVYVSLIELDTDLKRVPLFTIYRILRGLGIVENFTIFRNSEGYVLPLQMIEPRWPLDIEFNIVGGVALFKSIEEVTKVVSC